MKKKTVIRICIVIAYCIFIKMMFSIGVVKKYDDLFAILFVLLPLFFRFLIQRDKI